MGRIERKIEGLKEKRNAIVVAHHYQSPEIQDFADFVGGKMECALHARDSDASVVVVGGVDFMAELTKLFSPQKTVLLPRDDARCPMVAMLEEEQLENLGRGFVMGYIKARAFQMAHCHALADFQRAEEILGGEEKCEEGCAFIPDKYVGSYIAGRLEKDILLAEAYCPPHSRILSTQLKKLQEVHPGAETIVHPQCRGDVIHMADRVMNTTQMVEHIGGSSRGEFIVGTEVGLQHRLEKEFPDKKFYFVSQMARCSTHKRNGLGDVYLALKEMEEKVEIPKEQEEKIKKALSRGGYQL